MTHRQGVATVFSLVSRIKEQMRFAVFTGFKPSAPQPVPRWCEGQGLVPLAARRL